MDQFIPDLRDETVQTAVKNLLIYSFTIISVPLGSMFLLKKFFFEGNFLIIREKDCAYAACLNVAITWIVPHAQP